MYVPMEWSSQATVHERHKSGQMLMVNKLLHVRMQIT